MSKDLKQNLSALNSLIKELNFEEALTSLYSDEIVTSENGNISATGLQAYLEAARIFLSSVTNYKAELLHVITGKDISACHWHYVFDHKQWGHWDKEQISVQSWKDGKIVREIHFYN